MKMIQRAGHIALLAWLAVGTGACAALRPLPELRDPRTPEEIRRDSIAAMMEQTRASVPESPYALAPATDEGARVWAAGVKAGGLRILVDTGSRGLWLMRDSTVLLRAPVAVGMEEGFVYDGRSYDFQTPLGRRTVLAKDTMPLWVPPDWHYYELAHERDLRPVFLKKGQAVELEDGTRLEIRGSDVGRVNQFGNFWPFTPGAEIIFDGRVFIPPFGTRQRQIPDVLGTHKLVMGDGYLIHGTNQETSIGDAVSHGCVRMYNEDVARLHADVPVGTPVFIF